LSARVAVSSIAARGTRLLSELIAEELKSHAQNTNHSSQKERHRSDESNNILKHHEKSLNVAAFVKKFCESDQHPVGNSPIATTNVALWLQDNSFQSHSGIRRISEDQYTSTQENGSYSGLQSSTPHFYQSISTHPYHDTLANSIGQNMGEFFDIRSLNWFDDLLGLAPSHSI